MAFISSGYNPTNPWKTGSRTSVLGISRSSIRRSSRKQGTVGYHEIVKPGVLKHVALSGDVVYTVRVGAPGS